MSKTNYNQYNQKQYIQPHKHAKDAKEKQYYKHADKFGCCH